MAATDDALSTLLARNAALFALQETVGNQLEAFGFVSSAVSGHSMEIALLNAGQVQYIRDNLASPPDEAAIRWTNGAPVTPGDALANFIQSTLGYSDFQMTALFAAARQIA